MTDENATLPMRAVIIVAYIHASQGDDRVREARDIMTDALMEDGPDWVDDGVQMLTATIQPLDSDESVEFYIEDLDDLDGDDEWDMDDLRYDNRDGSTPR